MPSANDVPLTGLSSLSDQLDGMKTPVAQRLLKQYGQITLSRLLNQQQDFRRLSLYDDHLRRAEDKSLGLDMPDTPADEELRIDSPTTTIVQRGVPAWAIALIAAAMAIGGAGLTALLNRPAAPVPVVPQPSGPVTIDASSLRATIE